MTYPSCTSALALLAAPALVSASLAQAVDVWTVGVNNTRQGWNRFETVLTPANVPRLKKIREFVVDEKIDVSPLVVGDKLYVFTMTNTAYVFDVNTGAQLATRQLAAPFDPADIANPRGRDGPPQHLPQLGNYGDAGDRRGNEHYLCHDVRKTKRHQPEHRAQQHALDSRREHARRQEATGAYRRQCRQRRRRDRERLHDAVPEDARGPGAVDRRRWEQGRRGLVLHQWREPARSGTRIRRRVRRARPQSRRRFHADAGDLECHPGRRRRRRVDVGLRAGDRR